MGLHFPFTQGSDDTSRENFLNEDVLLYQELPPDFWRASERLERACHSTFVENLPRWHGRNEFHKGQAGHAMRVATCPMKPQSGAPIVQNENDRLVLRDNVGDEFIEIKGMLNEPV